MYIKIEPTLRSFGGRVSSYLDNIETTHAFLYFYVKVGKSFILVLHFIFFML